METNQEHQQRSEMTGVMVLIWLLAFFGIVFAINGVLVHAAISTFGGVETTSSYQAGLKFEQDVATAQRQDARHWQVNGNLRRDGAGRTVLNVMAHDEKGVPLSGLTAEARLAHPANESLDHAIPLRAGAAGVFHGSVEARPGQWDLIIDLYRGDQRLFRSSNRVTLN